MTKTTIFKIIILIVGIIMVAGLIRLFIGIDVSGKPLDFQINCDVNNTECHVSSEDTNGDNYGLMAVTYSPNGNAFNDTFSKGNCTIEKVYDMEFYNAPEETRYLHLGNMQVKYSYEVVCYSMGTLKLEELWK